MFSKYKGEIGLGLTALIWGSGFIGVSISLSGGLTPLQIMTIRFFIGAVLLGIIFFKEIKNNITKEAVKAGSMIGVFLFIAFAFQKSERKPSLWIHSILHQHTRKVNT